MGRIPIWGGKNMLTKSFGALALIAACMVTGVPLGPASSQSSTGSTGSFPGWYDTNATAAQSRANLIEHVLSPSAVPKAGYLRSVVAPVVSPGAPCRYENIAAPLLAGGNLYAITSGKLSKYNPATGQLIWRRAPHTNFTFVSLAISGNLVIA